MGATAAVAEPVRRSTPAIALPTAVLGRWAPWAVVAVPVAVNLILLHALVHAVVFNNDSAMHEQMVRFATAELRAGRDPLTSWFPYLGLGSADFLHYQSLPAVITGAVGLLVGPDVAFHWSLYLLLSLWPLSVYAGARCFGLPVSAAAFAALMSPLLTSTIGIGYEQNAYLPIGFGVWTQLWASCTLPLAWGLSFRALRLGRGFAVATAAVALTCALHFETGYLALMPLVLWPLIADGSMRRRLGRGALLLGGALTLAAWVIVPLLTQRAWAGTNEALHGTPLENGYGARRVLGWLLEGRLLDSGRLPVITVLMAIGVAGALIRTRRDPRARALLVVLAGCLALSFGRTTFHGVVNLLPGSGDIFFRRFMMGVQLAGLLLAGWGAADLSSGLVKLLRAPRAARWLVLGAVAAAATVPGWLQLSRFDARNAAMMAGQQAADSRAAAVDRLAAIARHSGGGRIYAGQPTNWGPELRVGHVPLFKYVESGDVDEVGDTLRTASLMTAPEFAFDAGQPSDYLMFGIRYLLLPRGWRPPVAASVRATAGAWTLWTVHGGGYIHLGTIVGDFAASRSDVGRQSVALLHSDLFARGGLLAVRWASQHAPVPAGSGALPRRAIGQVRTQGDNLETGTFSADVDLSRPGTAVLSASDDAGWQATVDGHPVRPVMLAPALVGVHVATGRHRVVFRFRGYREYPELAVIGLVALLALAAIDRRRRRAATG